MINFSGRIQNPDIQSIFPEYKGKVLHHMVGYNETIAYAHLITYVWNGSDVEANQVAYVTSNSNRVFFRHFENNSWTDWTENSLKSDLDKYFLKKYIGKETSIAIDLSEYTQPIVIEGNSVNNSSVHNHFKLGYQSNTLAILENEATSAVNVNYSFSITNGILTISNSGNYGSTISMVIH